MTLDRIKLISKKYYSKIFFEELKMLIELHFYEEDFYNLKFSIHYNFHNERHEKASLPHLIFLQFLEYTG